MGKTLIDGMIIINTRVGFDNNIFIKDKEQKLVYKIRNKSTDEMEDKRVSAVILKMDENNQYINSELTTPTIRELCLL